MRALTLVVAVGGLVAAVALQPAFAKPGGGNKGGAIRGLDRADVVAGSHGAHGRAVARSRGVHSYGRFCPPGQAKKGRC
jgi:hypothetical protein